MVLARGSSKDLQDRLQPLRLVRILKMARAVRLFRKLNELQQKDTSGHLKHFLSVFRAIFLSLFVAHCLACAFYMVIDRSADNWLGVCPCACGQACDCACARARACVVCVRVCLCVCACVRAYVCKGDWICLLLYHVCGCVVAVDADSLDFDKTDNDHRYVLGL